VKTDLGAPHPVNDPSVGSRVSAIMKPAVFPCSFYMLKRDEFSWGPAMASLKRIIDKAESRFSEGYNCAESVLLTLSEYESMKSPLIPKIATPFGGGIARSASICGCVTGALMAIGMRHGRRRAAEDKLKAYAVATGFMTEFERRFGSLVCYELIGCDFRTPEGQKRFEELRESRCTNFVKAAVEIVLSAQNRAV
jgi:C_GCAxxG_C_C family probable redox protein